MKNIETEKASISLINRNTVKISVRDNVHLEEEDVREFNRAKLKLVKDSKHSVLVLSGQDTTISIEARQLSANLEIG